MTGFDRLRYSRSNSSGPETLRRSISGDRAIASASGPLLMLASMISMLALSRFLRRLTRCSKIRPPSANCKFPAALIIWMILIPDCPGCHQRGARSFPDPQDIRPDAGPGDEAEEVTSEDFCFAAGGERLAATRIVRAPEGRRPWCRFTGSASRPIAAASAICSTIWPNTAFPRSAPISRETAKAAASLQSSSLRIRAAESLVAAQPARGNRAPRDHRHQHGSASGRPGIAGDPAEQPRSVLPRRLSRTGRG